MKGLILTAVLTISLATVTMAQTQPQIEQNDTSICLGESIGLNLIGILPNSSNCIGNLGTPNPWPFPSASGGGYIPLGTLGAQSVFSISMWINPATVQNGVSIIIDASHGGSANWVIQTLNSGSTWTWGSGVFTLVPNTWQHLLLTYNSGSRKIFINGNEVQSWFQTISYSGSPALYLGNWPEGGRRFSGLIDELHITTDILQTNNFVPEEIIQNQSANTFGLWHFDEGTGNSTNNTSNVSYPLNSWFWDSRNDLSISQYSILWSTGETTENISVAPNIDSQYTVTIDDGATIFYDTININVAGNSLTISPFLNQVQTGSLASFTASTLDPNPSYVWQTDLGVGFQNINNVGQYTGATSSTLTVSNVSLTNNNQPFRCIVTSGACSDTSDVAVLTVVDGGLCSGEVVYGCEYLSACNFNAEATVGDGSCIFPEPNYDCEGNCLLDANMNGICDQLETVGPTYCGEGTIWDAALNMCIGFNACLADFDNSGAVDVADILAFLSLYGNVCD